jgi:hypothetical protein
MKKVLLLLVFFSIKAHALFLLNPYLGSGPGEFTVGSSNKGATSSTNAGAHLAYQEGIYTLGLDVSYTKYNFAKNFLNARQKYYNGYDWGLIAGVASQGFRVWAVADLSSMRMSTGSDGFYFGRTYKFGFGIKVVGDVFVNIESIKTTFNENEINNETTNKLSSNIKINTILISVSIPSYF